MHAAIECGEKPRSSHRFSLPHGGRGELRSLCKKDDHEEEIAQFDVETLKKVIINDVSIFLSTVNNLKLPPEGFWLGRRQVPCHAHG